MRHLPTPAGWVLLLSLLLPGCASKSSTQGENPLSYDTPVALEVENHNTSDVVIYLVRGNQRERLGMVTGLNTSTFTFPYRRLGTTGNARLRAHAIGGRTDFTSEDLLVQPGQMIKWTLENDLDRSSLAVY